ncbi:hypothetical protein E4T45_05088 [Aureobasidium sp. EXF-8846]|nr:hypothetical protein E4T45_05088 [Aureobasidium sp. EXF-8846]
MSNTFDGLAAASALMPMSGEAEAGAVQDKPLRPLGSAPSASSHQSPSAPLNQSPSPRPSEGRQAPRRSSLDVVAEAQDDVGGSLEGLDQKHPQLVDRIHNSTTQKEQAIKLHERELRTRRRISPRSSIQPPGNTMPTYWSADAADNRQDARATEEKGHERGSELPGPFTAAYLPLLDNGPSGPGRSLSAPVLSAAADPRRILPDRQVLQRANIDPAGDNESSLSRRG